MAAITPRQRGGWLTANFVVIALALIPVLWLASLSFKTPTAVLDPSFIPSQWTWGNYHGILTSSQFLRPLLNSIGIGIIATVIAVVLRVHGGVRRSRGCNSPAKACSSGRRC